jgi:hypothetical protein
VLGEFQKKVIAPLMVTAVQGFTAQTIIVATTILKKYGITKQISVF